MTSVTKSTIKSNKKTKRSPLITPPEAKQRAIEIQKDIELALKILQSLG